MKRRVIGSNVAKAKYGVIAHHEQMENGELRFRLKGSDGNGYIRTVGSATGGWQNAHHHTLYRELYLVEKGWMAIAVPDPKTHDPELMLFESGETYVTGIGEVHNVYLSGGAVLHTVKFGSTAADANWTPNADFTLKTQAITEADLLKKARRKSDV